MANLAIFKSPEPPKKQSEVKYFFLHLNSGNRYLHWSIKTLSKTIISIGENGPSKKNHTEHKYSVFFFESWNNKTARISGQNPERFDCPFIYIK